MRRSHAMTGAPEAWRRLWPCPLCRRGSAILAVIDKLIHDSRIGECGRVTECIQFVGRNLAQDTTHDFSRPGFRQTGCPLNDIWCGDRADFAAHQRDQFLAQFICAIHTDHQGDVGVDALSFDVVWVADHCGFRHLVVQYQRALDFSGAHAVTGDVDDIVNATGDPVIAIGVTTRTVAGEVIPGVRAEVGFLEASMIAIQGAHLTWPGLLDDQ